MIWVHESTKALSVYNAIKECGALTPEQVIAVLRRKWEPDFGADDLGEALAYLQARGMVSVGATIGVTRVVDGAAATLIRNPRRHTELIYGTR